MAKCKECAWYRPGGICKHGGLRNGGFTSPLQDVTGRSCFTIPGQGEQRIDSTPEVVIPIKPRKRRKPLPEAVPGEPTKVCTRCGRELPLSAFFRRTRARDGLTPHCKECTTEEIRARNIKRFGRPW